MKNILLILAVALLVTACGNGGKKGKSASEVNAAAKTETSVLASSFSVDTLMHVADSYISKPISVHGFVTHVCKHSGKRCFIVDENQKYSIRVEAKEGIGGFNRELVGSQIVAKGVLRERRLSQQEIASMEAATNKKKAEDGSAETCAAELSNIAKMRSWMKERGKDYYAIYYVDGNEYEVVD
ncbi:MAG: hypothetical protein LBK47_10740 [Prevotellaceae bacterium]|jgi:hypothetical protein|nr:hypothetical protein [Prevotellaceae bacterium]